MAEENKIKEKATEKLNKVKSEIEHLEVQLTLGKAEAAKQFESTKKELNDAVGIAKEKVNELSEKGKQKIEELKPELEHLQVQLALGKAESLDAYKKYEQDVKAAINNFKAKAKSMMDNHAHEGEDKWKEVVAEAKEKATKFQTQLDIYRVQLALGEAEVKQEFSEKTEEFMRDAKVISAKIDENLSGLEETVEELGDEIAEKFGEMKDKFLSWF